MYQHHMRFEEQFGARKRLCYNDTDSLIYHIAGKRGTPIYDELREMYFRWDMFDLSEIEDPSNHPMTRGMSREQVERNKKVLGKLKDETKGVPIREAIFLRSKTYSIKLERPIMEPHPNKKKAARGKRVPKGHIAKKKGIPKRLPDDQDLLFGHKAYREIYYGGTGPAVRFPTISHTKRLALYTAVQTKAGLARLDDKSYWFNAASCLRYGHWRIAKIARKLERPNYTRAELYIEDRLADEWEQNRQRIVELTEAEAVALSEHARLQRELFDRECADLQDGSVSDIYSTQQWVDMVVENKEIDDWGDPMWRYSQLTYEETPWLSDGEALPEGWDAQLYASYL